MNASTLRNTCSLLLIPMILAASTLLFAGEMPSGPTESWQPKGERTADQLAAAKATLGEIQVKQAELKSLEEQLAAEKEDLKPIKTKVDAELAQIEKLTRGMTALAMQASAVEKMNKGKKDDAKKQLLNDEKALEELADDLKVKREYNAYYEQLKDISKKRAKAEKLNKSWRKKKTEAEKTQVKAQEKKVRDQIAEMMQSKDYTKAMNKFNEEIAKLREKQEKKLTKRSSDASAIQSKIAVAKGEIRSLEAKRARQLGHDVGVSEGNIDISALLNKSGAEGTEWLDFETGFVEKLGENGYEDLAEVYLEQVKESTHPATGNPLSDKQKNYLNKVTASLKMQAAFRTRDLGEKITLAQEATELKTQVIGLLVPGTLMYYDASIDLASTYFRLAEHIADAAFREQRLTGEGITVAVPQPKEVDKKPSKDGKKDKDDMADAAEADAPAEVVAEAPATGTSNVAEALTLAGKFYTDGLSHAQPTYERVNDIFVLLHEKYMEALGKGDGGGAEGARILEALNTYGMRKIKIQHVMENAYASWPVIYPVASEERLKIAKSGAEFIDYNMLDYQDFWNTDKLVYAYMMGVTGYLVDPVKEWSGNAGDRVSPAPNKDEYMPEELIYYEMDLNDVVRWKWPSDKVQKIWELKIIGKNENQDAPTAYEQAQRVRALYFYGQAMSTLAMTHLTLADASGDQKMKDHAEELHGKAMKALDETIKPNSRIGNVDQTTRFNARLKLRVDYFLFLAERAVKAGDKDKAAEWIMLAIAEAAAVQSEGNSNWRVTAEQYMNGILKVQMRLGIGKSGVVPPSVLITEADALLKESSKERNVAKSRAKLYEAIDKYLVGIDAYRGIHDKADRENKLPKALFNLGIAAIKVEDYELGYLANWEIVQEFHNKFDNPTRGYDPDKYSNAKKYLPKAMKHMQYSAFNLMKIDKGELPKEMYVDALIKITELKDSGTAGQETVQLIDTLKKMKQYDKAVRFIDNVPKDNMYYVLIQLMAADIWQTMMKSSIKRIEAIDRQLNPQPNEEGEIPPEMVLSDEQKAVLEAEKAELAKQIDRSRKNAKKYADRYIKLVMEQKPLPDWASDELKKVREQEKRNLLQAMLIPVGLDITEKKWVAAAEGCKAYIEQVRKQSGVTAEDRQDFLAQGYWFWFVSVWSQGDYETMPIADAKELLTKAAAQQALLDEADTSRKYMSDSAMMMGGAYMRLAGRLRDQAAAIKEESPEDPQIAQLGQREDTLRLDAVNQFLKAEEALYKKGNMGLGISMMGTMIDQELFTRAEEIGDNVIAYWSESLFTPASIYNGKKTAKDLAAAEMDEEIDAQIGTLLAPIKTAAAQGDDAVLNALNEMVETLDAKANADAIGKALKVAYNRELSKPSIRQDARTLKSLEQAERILGRLERDEQMTPEIRNRLNRIVIESAYPEVIYQAAYVPVLPSPKGLASIGQTILKAPSDRSGIKKAAILAAMIDPELIKGLLQEDAVAGRKGGDGKRTGGYIGEIKDRIDATDDEEEKAKLKRLLQNFEEPLPELIFGVRNEETGKIEKRNYQKAAENIQVILNWDKANEIGAREPTPERKRLADIRDALGVANTIVYAKMSYARTMVEVGKFIEAKSYLETLANFFPNHPSIKMDLALALAAMGANEKNGDKVVPRTYSAEAAKNFMNARYKLIEVLNIYRDPNSEIYWNGWAQYYESGVSEVLARKRSGEAGTKEYTVDVTIFDPKTGEDKLYKKKTDKLDDHANSLMTDMARMAASSNPEPPEAFLAKVDELTKQLADAGYEVVSVKKASEFELPETKADEKPEEEGDEKGDAPVEGEGDSPAEGADPAVESDTEAAATGDADADATSEPPASSGEDTEEPATTEDTPVEPEQAPVEN